MTERREKGAGYHHEAKIILSESDTVRPSGAIEHKERYIDNTEGVIVSEISGTWNAVTKNAEGEAQIHTLAKHSVKTRPLPVELQLENILPKAHPIHITPSRAKPKNRKNKVAFDIPDLQMGWRMNERGLMTPTHSPEAIDVMLQVLYDVQPDLVVLGGDEQDWPEFSRFTPDSNQFSSYTLQDALTSGERLFAQLRANAPNARIHNLASNHNTTRLDNYLAKAATVLLGVRRAGDKYPLISYPNLLQLEKYDIEYVGGYPAEVMNINDRLITFHGDKATQNSTAHQYLADLDSGMGLMFHHTHRREEAYKRRKHSSAANMGRQSVAFSFGCLANIDGAVPSFNNAVKTNGQVARFQENWVNGFGVVEYDEGDAPFRQQFVHIDDTDGFRAWFNGKEYTPQGLAAAGYSYQFGTNSPAEADIL